MKNNITEMVFVLDRSGSMHGLEDDTIGGFNSMLKEQQAKEGEAFISTILFGGECHTLHDRLPIKEVLPLTKNDYRVFGCTALLDAIGGAIEHIGNIHRYIRPEDVPAHTVFVIITDGMENASKRFSGDRIRSMIEEKKEKHGWEFLFLGANMDAALTASSFGIAADRAASYKSDGRGTRLNYEVVSEAICAVRGDDTLPAGWKRRIDNYRRSEDRS